MSTPKYVARFARVARAIPILALHPAGMRLSDLAEQQGASEAELRAEIKAYYVADPPHDLVGGHWEPVIEFVSDPAARPDDEEYPDVDTAAYVRLRDMRFGPNVGVKFLTVGELAVASRAGHDLLVREPENTVLEKALDALADTVLDGFDRGGPRWLGKTARTVRDAMRARRRVWIRYARAWHPGVVDRVIEPYQVIHTRRGWEVDAAVALDDEAGPNEAEGDEGSQRGEGTVGDEVGHSDRAVRTFLVSGIRELEVLDEAFDRPADVAELVRANRTLQPVEVVVPHGARWAVELYAESADVLTEDELSVRLRAQLLPPVGRRLGLLLLAAGPDAVVVHPEDLADAGRRLARELLDHHAADDERT